jgi:cytoskeletal protein RodZ
MSQQKVDKYKQEKANRRETLKKQKRNKMLTKIGLGVLAVVVVGGIAGGIGYTGYNQYKSYVASQPDYSSTSKVITDYTSILETESESESASEETTESTTEGTTEGTTESTSEVEQESQTN